MKIYYECFPCFIKQGITVLNKVVSKGFDENPEYIKALLHRLADLEDNMTPPEIAKIIFEFTELYYPGVGDLYIDEKKKSNDYILAMEEELRSIILNSKDPIDTAIRLAVTGNNIDFGANPNYIDEQIHKEIDRALLLRLLISLHIEHF